MRYYLLSLPLDAQHFAIAIRGHWGIENQLHWMLDVAFREDQSRATIGYSGENLAVIRHLAVNLLKKRVRLPCTEATSVPATANNAHSVPLDSITPDDFPVR